MGGISYKWLLKNLGGIFLPWGTIDPNFRYKTLVDERNIETIFNGLQEIESNWISTNNATLEVYLGSIECIDYECRDDWNTIGWMDNEWIFIYDEFRTIGILFHSNPISSIFLGKTLDVKEMARQFYIELLGRRSPEDLDENTLLWMGLSKLKDGDPLPFFI